MKKTIQAAAFLGLVSCALSTLFAQGQPGGLQDPAATKATISGTVVRIGTGEPIARATVTLAKVIGPGTPTPGTPNAGARGGGPQQPQQAQVQQQQPFNVTATTDEQGKFQFKDLAAGAYRLAAARNGFARQEFGQRTLNRPGTPVNLRAGQSLVDVAFRLTPAGTISGRVLDVNGEPLTGVTVQALRSSYDATGKRNLQPVGTARTNDLGEYRIYWINPGRYVVSANSARSALDLIAASASQAESPEQAQAAAIFGPVATPNEVPDSGFALTYYPGVTDASRAAGVDLPPGREVRAVDFTLGRTQRVRVTGRVIDGTAGKPPQMAQVSVTPRDSSLAVSPLDFIVGMDPSQQRYNPETGEFTVQSVASGSYWLQVISPGQMNTQPPADGAIPNAAEAMAVLAAINTTRIPLEVANSDITNLTLTVTSGITVPGRIRIEGTQASNPVTLDRIGISLQSASGGGSILTLLAGGAVRPAADGTFSIPRITPGDYRLTINGLGINLYIKDARLNQTDVLQGGLTISDAFNGSLDITLGANPGQVSGTVTDAGLEPVAAVQAVLIPDRARGRQDLYKTVVTDQEGRFTIRGVTPGDYRLFAWEDIEPFSYFDAAVLMQYEQQGKAVRVQESSAESVEVKLIPAPTP